MGFICESCKKAQPPRTQPKKIVTTVRKVTYQPEVVQDKYGNEYQEQPYFGYETASEALVCPACAKRIEDAHLAPSVVAQKVVLFEQDKPMRTYRT